MTAARLRRVGDVVLSILAGVGVLCVVLTVAGLLFGVRPLVFTSGSMSPSIDAGALAFATPVDADELAVGDVVSVTSGGSRVTHRITDIDMVGDRAVLTLKGDANVVEDATPYTVDSADRVVFDVPWLGHVVSALSGEVGVFVAGMLAAGLLFLILRPSRRHRSTGRRASRDGKSSAPNAALVLALLALPLLVTTGRALPTMAAWTDDGDARTGEFEAHVVQAQEAPTCNDEGGVLGLLGYAEIEWPHVDERYEYEWSAIRVSDGQQLNSGVVSPAGPAGTTATLEVRIGLLNLGLGGTEVDIRVRSRLTGTSGWRASTQTVTRVRTAQLLVGLSVRCGTVDRSGPVIGFTAPTAGVDEDAQVYREVVRDACGQRRPGCGTVSDPDGIQAMSYRMTRVLNGNTEYFHASSAIGGIWNSNDSFEDASFGDGVWEFDGLISTAYFDRTGVADYTLEVRAVDTLGNATTSAIEFTLR